MDMSINLCGVTLKNPVIAASGTFGYGREYAEFFPISRLGAVSCKGTTLRPREGNDPPRIYETAAGMLNSVGLQNPGLEVFIRDHLPWMKAQGAVVVANIAGFSVAEYAEIAERLSDTAADIIELNISCPNVAHGGAAFGTSCASAGQVTKAVRDKCTKPLMVKLSPNVTAIGDIAAATEAAGADAVSLINTITGMRINYLTRRPMLANNVGGLSGPAVLPVAIRMVNEVWRRVSIPVVGMGGITTWSDAAEMMIAGAAAVQVGTATFADPFAMLKIIEGLEQFAVEQRLSSISELTGTLEVSD
ncbi:MAG: dihydroorotate dehydrogenase [Oscillospiraceae bacterium]|nr:dihydroorotate dehydrogenase [Oscillospiraceae bacterium]